MITVLVLQHGQDKLDQKDQLLEVTASAIEGKAEEYMADYILAEFPDIAEACKEFLLSNDINPTYTLAWRKKSLKEYLIHILDCQEGWEDLDTEKGTELTVTKFTYND